MVMARVNKTGCHKKFRKEIISYSLINEIGCHRELRKYIISDENKLRF